MSKEDDLIDALRADILDLAELRAASPWLLITKLSSMGYIERPALLGMEKEGLWFPVIKPFKFKHHHQVFTAEVSFEELRDIKIIYRRERLSKAGEEKYGK